MIQNQPLNKWLIQTKICSLAQAPILAVFQVLLLL
jgi:hypothetical protein